MAELAQDTRARRLAWVALGFTGLALALVVVEWLKFGRISWTSLGLLAAIAANVGPRALGWTRTRPSLARVCSMVSVALVVGVLFFEIRGVPWGR